MSAHRVVFTPSGKRSEFGDGMTLLAAARELGVDLDSVCGGRGICGRCQVDIAEGDFAKHAIHSSADHVTPWGEVESRYTDKRGPLAAARRLGCQARICGDLVVDVPPESQVHRQVVRKRAETHPIEIDPVVRLYYVEVAEPDMHEPSSDLRRLQQALCEQWGMAEASADLATLATLQKTLRAGQWKVTAALRKSRDIVAVMPGFAERAYGVAIDVGSTTIAAHLTDLMSGEVVAARVHHHVGDAAHQVFAEADLRVHRPDRCDNLAAHEIGQMRGDGGRADVDGEPVDALVQSRPDRNDPRAVMDLSLIHI